MHAIRSIPTSDIKFLSDAFQVLDKPNEGAIQPSDIQELSTAIRKLSAQLDALVTALNNSKG